MMLRDSALCHGRDVAAPRWTAVGAAVELLKLKEERIHFPLPKPAEE